MRIKISCIRADGTEFIAYSPFEPGETQEYIQQYLNRLSKGIKSSYAQGDNASFIMNTEEYGRMVFDVQKYASIGFAIIK